MARRRRGYNQTYVYAMGGDRAPGWYVRYAWTDASGRHVEDVGPVRPDRRGRGWAGLPVGLVAYMDPRLARWRLQRRVAGLTWDAGDDPHDLGLRISDPEDARRWVYCDGKEIKLRATGDLRDLVAAHERAHAGVHRGPQRGSGLTVDDIVREIRRYLHDHGGVRPLEKDLVSRGLASVGRISKVAGPGGGYAHLVDRAVGLGPLADEISTN
jgi:hypothetical protein